MTDQLEKSEVSSHKPEVVPTPSSAVSALDQLQDKLLTKLRLNFGERTGLTTGVKYLQTGSGFYLLSECLRRHFQVNDSVAADLIATSTTVADIAEKLAELKGLTPPSLFSSVVAPGAPGSAVPV